MVAFRIFLTIPYGYSKAPLTFCLWRSVRFHSQRKEKIRIVKSRVSPGGRNGWRDVRQSGEGLARAGCFLKDSTGPEGCFKKWKGGQQFYAHFKGKMGLGRVEFKRSLSLTAGTFSYGQYEIL